jgi:hypothetical protein
MHSGLNFFDEHLTAEQLVERKLVPFTKSGLDQMRYLGRGPPYLKVGYKVFDNVDSVRAWLTCGQSVSRLRPEAGHLREPLSCQTDCRLARAFAVNPSRQEARPWRALGIDRSARPSRSKLSSDECGRPASSPSSASDYRTTNSDGGVQLINNIGAQRRR